MDNTVWARHSKLQLHRGGVGIGLHKKQNGPAGFKRRHVIAIARGLRRDARLWRRGLSLYGTGGEGVKESPDAARAGGAATNAPAADLHHPVVSSPVMRPVHRNAGGGSNRRHAD